MTRIACLLLAVATFALYAAVLGHGFVHFDDHLYVTENPNVRAGLTWPTIRWALTAYQVGNWHPVTLLSHALDCQLHGVSPAGHHLTSLLLHVANVLLLFLLLARATGSPWRSGLVAALFAFHPLNVESVAWVAERKNVLSTLLFLLTLGAWGWYARRASLARYLLVALLFGLGLAAKPILVTLPCVLLLLDFWPLGRIRGWSEPGAPLDLPQHPLSRLVPEKLPLLALSGADIYVTLEAQRSASALGSLLEFPLSVRIENAIYAYGMYVLHAVWPTRLTHLYPHPGDALTLAQLGAALAFLSAVSALVWRARRGHPYLVTGWLWYLGILVPVIGLVQAGEQAFADRYAYVPLLGLFVMAVWGAAELADRWALGIPARAAAAAGILALLCALTVRQVGFWQNNLDLWLRALDVTTDNYLAEENVGLALGKQGRFEEASAYFRNAARIKPDDALVRANLAAALARAGRFDDAISEYASALRVAQDPWLRAAIHADLGTAYRMRGETFTAFGHYQRALAIEPKLPTAVRGMRALQAAPDTAPGR